MIKVEDGIEILSGELSDVQSWEKAVWQTHRSRCSNCGAGERLRVKAIVPIEAGGQLVPSNGALLCRSCEMASDSYSKSSKGENQRLVNFWVSRPLFERLKTGLERHNGFTSMGSLVRYLMAKYVEDESRFDDLELYQDEGADVKVNVWVDRDRYNTFKALLDKRGMTVTDAIKSLIRAYEEGAEPLIERRSRGASDA